MAASNHQQEGCVFSSLPKTLDETYARILRQIPEEHRQNASRLLQFLAWSERPLRLQEAVDILAVHTDGDLRFDPMDRMPQPQEIVIYCSSLVTVSEVETFWDDTIVQELQLTHFSVKEYLISDRLDVGYPFDLSKGIVAACIANVLLVYLLHIPQVFKQGENLSDLPLARYSAVCWATFARLSESHDKIVQELVQKLFLGEAYTQWLGIYHHDVPDLDQDKNAYPKPIYYAALEGLQQSAVGLIACNANVNTTGGFHGSALHAASSHGHERIVQLLLKEGADVNSRASFFGTAL